MAYYERKTFNSDGKFICKSVEKYPSSFGRWKRNQELDKKDNIKTRVHTRNSNTGLNKVVTGSYSVFPDGTKMTTKLISNSSKFPKTTKKDRKGKKLW